MKVKDLIRDLQDINPEFEISLINADDCTKSRNPDLEIRIHKENNECLIVSSINKFFCRDYLFWCDPV